MSSAAPAAQFAAPFRASHRPIDPTSSTTALMRAALTRASGEYAGAIRYLEPLALGPYENAAAAIRCLNSKARRHPRATHFQMLGSGFIRPATVAAETV